MLFCKVGVTMTLSRAPGLINTQMLESERTFTRCSVISPSAPQRPRPCGEAAKDTAGEVSRRLSGKVQTKWRLVTLVNRYFISFCLEGVLIVKEG